MSPQPHNGVRARSRGVRARSRGVRARSRGVRARSRRALRFGVHQALEYLSALLVLANLARVGEGNMAVIAVAGGAILGLAAVTHGPLCALRWLSPRAHAVGDVVVAAGLAAGAVLMGFGRGAVPAAVILGAAAAFQLFLAASTDYRVRSRQSLPTLPGLARVAGRAWGVRRGSPSGRRPPPPPGDAPSA